MIGWLIFVLGLCVGSFINCLVYRLHLFSSTSEEPLRVTIRGVLGGRSFCDDCRRQLRWSDNIPVISFLLLKGRCRYCHSPISWQYPLVELTTGVLSLIVYRLSLDQISNFQFPISNLIYNLLITYVLIAIFVSDLRYRTIPDEIVYPAIGITLIFRLSLAYYYHATVCGNSAVCGGSQGDYLLAGMGAAGFFLWLVFLTRGKGMGLGDVKLAGLMGIILGFPKIIVALILAFLTGAIWGVILVLMGKKKFKSPIPFGPFLTGATFVSLLL